MIAALVAAPGFALAHGAATGIVKERMDLMIVLRDAMKVLRTELAMGGDYEPGVVARSAGVVRDHAGEAMTRLFPDGSTAHSEALPTVWSEPERFALLAEDLARYAGAMQLAAQTGATARAPAVSAMMGDAEPTPDAETLVARHPVEAFAAVAKTCSACHADYRMKTQ